MALADPMNYGNTPGNGPLRVGGQSGSFASPSDAAVPSTESPTVKRMQPAVTMARDLYAGNEKVRAAGTTYLPKAPAERPTDYATRLNRSVFTNFFRRTVEGLAGFVFRADPELGEDVPPVIATAPPCAPLVPTTDAAPSASQAPDVVSYAM